MRNSLVRFSHAIFILLTAAAFFMNNAVAVGQTAEVLYRFLGQSDRESDGYSPYGNLVFDRAGNLYGTTEYGGASFYGTVFELSPPEKAGGSWKQTRLYSFSNTGDGARPTDGLIFDNKGNLYGTTGDSDAGGYGEVFELSPPTENGGAWVETVLYSFQGETDGAYPYGGLIMDAQGNLYGTTETSVFELNPPAQPGGSWTFNLLHLFGRAPTDGYYSHAGLVRDASGNLYGTTLWGGYQGNPDCGSIGCGTAFEVSPPAAPGGAWTETVIHEFGMGTDGLNPESGLVVDTKGNLYGTTYSGGAGGGGTVFRLSPPSQSGGAWVERVIHSFAYSHADGAAPVGTLIMDGSGNLYSTTLFGGNDCFFNGADYGCGTVYELSPTGGNQASWNETILYFFTRPFGQPRQSAAGVVMDAEGNLYGTTVFGGIDGCPVDQGEGCGTVYEIVR